MRPKIDGFQSLRGSKQDFRKRENAPLSELHKKERERNTFFLAEGIIVLRQLKTQVFEQPQNEQALLDAAYYLADLMATCILADTLDPQFRMESHPYFSALQEYQRAVHNQQWTSKNQTPATSPIHTLYQATEDMIVRAEELIGSMEKPDHIITAQEAEVILKQFLDGTNLINPGNRPYFFEPGTKIGGILSGGLVYTLLAKKITEYLSGNTLHLDVFAVAVATKAPATAHQRSGQDSQIRHVFLMDDMINSEATISQAVQGVKFDFLNAFIHSGNGVERPEYRAQEREKKLMEQIHLWFYEFADAIEEGNAQLAYQIYQQADVYRQQHRLQFTPAWEKQYKKLRALEGKK